MQIPSQVTAVLLIAALIFVHELGHFLFAKWTRVGVLKFSIGFGPALLRWRWGETTYQLSLIPLGGYVRMVGDIPDMITGNQATDDDVRGKERDDDEEKEKGREQLSPQQQAMVADRSRWFIEKGYWPRFWIVFAGPLFNFFFAIFLVFLGSFLYGEQLADERAAVGRVMPNSPAQEAGLLEGDQVLSIDGAKVADWTTMANTIRSSGGRALELRVSRNGEEIALTAQPKGKVRRTTEGKKKTEYLIGVEPLFHHRELGFIDSLKVGGFWTYTMTLRTYQGLWGMVTGKVSAKDLAGPVFIFEKATETARKGLESLLYFAALLSVSLAVLNLLPIPLLDGGHIMFFTIEAFLGPISMKKKERAQLAGIIFICFLMLFAVHNDLTRDSSPNDAKDAKVQWTDFEDAASEGASEKP